MYADNISNHDGIDDRPIPISCKIPIKGDRALIYFIGSSFQAAGSVNAVRAITISAILYAFRLLGPDEMPNNSGCMQPLQVMTQPGTIVDSVYPGAVVGENVETSQRIVDVLLGALSIALPEKILAASSGTMNNLTIGGVSPDSNISSPTRKPSGVVQAQALLVMAWMVSRPT